MYTISDVASALGLKVNKFRYWLKKNSDDCENNLYDFRLLDLMPKVHIYKKVKGKAKARNYEQYIILDLEEFKKEFEKYNQFSKSRKQQIKMDRAWSDSAVECYKHKSNCSGCSSFLVCMNIMLDTKNEEPPMKKFVQKLLLSNGKPPNM